MPPKKELQGSIADKKRSWTAVPPPEQQRLTAAFIKKITQKCARAPPDGMKHDRVGGPPVVRSLDELMDYPQDIINTAQASLPEGVVEYLRSMISSTTYTTAFSGIDAPGTALAVMASCLDCHEGGHLAAIEMKFACQQELRLHPTNSPGCLFSDMCSFFKPETLGQLEKAEAKGTILDKDGCVAVVVCSW